MVRQETIAQEETEEVMELSELINTLHSLRNEHGDLEVRICVRDSAGGEVATPNLFTLGEDAVKVCRECKRPHDGKPEKYLMISGEML